MNHILQVSREGRAGLSSSCDMASESKKMEPGMVWWGPRIWVLDESSAHRHGFLWFEPLACSRGETARLSHQAVQMWDNRDKRE